MTSKFCVVGSPIEHSLSPVIHEAAYTHLGLDYGYEKHELSSGGLQHFQESNDYDGLSVTMPLKLEAAQVSVRRSVEVEATGVSNTLIRDRSGWFAHNTDVHGFEKVFEHLHNPENITIIGSGATARSAALAVSKLYSHAVVTVIGRNPTSVAGLIEFCRSLGLRSEAGEPKAVAIESSDLIVSTVPADGFANLWSELAASTAKPKGVLFDVAYNPWPSLAARSWKGECIWGLELLIWQAIEQVRLFATSQGDSVDTDASELYAVMRHAIDTRN